MTKSRLAISGALVVLLTVLMVLVNLPVRFFLGDLLNQSGKNISYTDLGGASLLEGDLWVTLDGFPGLTHLTYQWCPGLSPLNWCVDLQHSAFGLSGQFAVSDLLSESLLIHVSDMDINALDIKALGIASGLIDARINGRIDRMVFELSNCPVKTIKQLQGELTSSNIQVFGFSAGAHQLSLASSESAVNARIAGSTFQGNIQVSGGAYRAEGEMRAPETMEAMARSLMRPLGGNRFGWQINGDLPC